MRYANSRFCNNADVARFECDGPFDIPVIRPEPFREGLQLVDFNTAMGKRSLRETRREQCIHFFIDDYRFERIWHNLPQYGLLMSEFGAVLTPDYSMFTDWPKMLQMWNHYRKHFVGAYLQSLGVTVWPTIGWSDETSYDWCFDGEPVGGCVAVSSVGPTKNRAALKLFMKGYDAMMERLQPESVLFYGKVPEGCKGNIIAVRPFYDRFDSGQGEVV